MERLHVFYAYCLLYSNSVQKTLLALQLCSSSSSWPTHSGDTLSLEPKSRISAPSNQACM